MEKITSILREYTVSCGNSATDKLLGAAAIILNKNGEKSRAESFPPSNSRQLTIEVDRRDFVLGRRRQIVLRDQCDSMGSRLIFLDCLFN